MRHFIVHTCCETFKFLFGEEAITQNERVHFSDDHSALQFLEHLLIHTRKPEFLRLVRDSLPNLCHWSKHQILDYLTWQLVLGYLQVKRMPFKPFELSPFELAYFTTQFDKLRANA